MIRTRTATFLKRNFTLPGTLSTTMTRHTYIPVRHQSSSSQIPKFPDPIKHAPLKQAGEVIPAPIEKTGDMKTEEPDEEVSGRRYIDTMEIFNELRGLGFTEKQSDIILRLINDNLTVMLNKINDKMLSRNELENELYLFEAAQSEMKVETKTSRELDLRTLQNEKATLENLVNEEFDELNKMHIVSRNDSQVVINDQTSENTLLQKTLKKRIQELNNKISTEIISDTKSEVEGLRWNITRNGLMAVLALVFAIMAGVNISKNKSKEEAPQQVILRTIQPEEALDALEEQKAEVSLEQLLDQQGKDKK